MSVVIYVNFSISVYFNHNVMIMDDNYCNNKDLILRVNLFACCNFLLTTVMVLISNFLVIFYFFQLLIMFIVIANIITIITVSSQFDNFPAKSGAKWWMMKYLPQENIAYTVESRFLEPSISLEPKVVFPWINVSL